MFKQNFCLPRISHVSGLRPFLFIMITYIFGHISWFSFYFPIFFCFSMPYSPLLAFSFDFISCSLKESTLTFPSHGSLSLLPIDIITIIVMNCFRLLFPLYFCFSVVREGRANVDEDTFFFCQTYSYYPIWFSSYLSQLQLYVRILTLVWAKVPMSTLLPISCSITSPC